MLRELFHLARHAPATLRLKSRLPQVDLYDELMLRGEAAGMAAHRRALVSDLLGEVLEIGSGTGLMFEHYPAEVKLTALELDGDFLARAGDRARSAAADVTLLRGDAASLAFPEEAFDAVVSSLVLCSVESPADALAEIARVLRPGAPLRLIEHVVSERPVAAALMRAADPLWLHLNGQGCRMARDTVATVGEAGFVVESVEAFQVFSPGLPAFPMRAIRARRG